MVISSRCTRHMFKGPSARVLTDIGGSRHVGEVHKPCSYAPIIFSSGKMESIWPGRYGPRRDSNPDGLPVAVEGRETVTAHFLLQFSRAAVHKRNTTFTIRAKFHQTSREPNFGSCNFLRIFVGLSLSAKLEREKEEEDEKERQRQGRRGRERGAGNEEHEKRAGHSQLQSGRIARCVQLGVF